MPAELGHGGKQRRHATHHSMGVSRLVRRTSLGYGAIPMNDTKKRAKSESGNYNILQTSHLQFLECRKTGSSGFPASSSEPPAGSNEPPARSGGFPTGSNALRIFPNTPEMIQITPNNRVFSARTVYNPALSQGSYDARNRGQTPTSRTKSIWSPRFGKMRRP
jgi:hypothetical protein